MPRYDFLQRGFHPERSVEQISDFFPLVFTLMIIILILLLSYYATRWIGGKTIQSRNSKHMKIVDTLAVTQDKSIIILQTNESHLLLSLSPTDIKLLTELKDFKPSESDLDFGENTSVSRDDFKKLLSQFKRNK